MRVLFVLEHYHPHVGGVETLFQQLAEGLAAIGHKVSVVTARLPGTKDRETCGGVEITRVNVPRWASRYFFTVLAVPAVFREARKCDLIHSTTYNAAGPAWVGSVTSGKPMVLTAHEIFGDQWTKLPGLSPLLGLAYRLYEWSILRLPIAYYICDSIYTKARLMRFGRVPAGRAAVVYPAVDYGFWESGKHRRRDLGAELGLRSGAFVYLYFGRPGISKGLEYLIEAARHVRERVPDSHLVLLLSKNPAGQSRAIRRQIARLDLSHYVTILDPVPREELAGYVLGADCVVVPSVSEGFGYAAVEAVALGRRVVATSGHAIEEVLGGSVDLVPPRDPTALAEAMIEAARKKEVARPAPRRYELATHLDGVLGVYQLLNIPARSPQTGP